MLMLWFTSARAASMDDDEFERERLEVWLVLILALTRLSALSTEDDEFERERLEV